MSTIIAKLNPEADVSPKDVAAHLVNEFTPGESQEDFYYILSMLFAGQQVIGEVMDDGFFHPGQNNCRIPTAWLITEKL
jgi:hypothetical protein